MALPDRTDAAAAGALEPVVVLKAVSRQSPGDEGAGSFDPANVTALLDLGEAMLRAGLADTAEAQFQVALSLAPRHHRALAALGRINGLRGDHLAALRHFQAAVHAGAPSMLVELAAEHQALGQWDAAAACYQAAADQSPESVAALFGLAGLARRRGDAGEAAAYLQAAAASDPQNAAIRLECGYGLLQLAEFDAAQAQFAAALGGAPQEARAGLVAVAAARPGHRVTLPHAQQTGSAAPDGPYTDPVEQVVARHLDRDYYLASNADVRADGIDPVAHYTWWGWREGRNPTATFDTAYYAENNPDVVAKGVNPFWHYLVAGQAEGRRARRPGGYRRTMIEAARDPDRLTAGYARTPPERLLTEAELHAAIERACVNAGGLVLSVGHDRYTGITGGVQLFIADEQAKFARLGYAYLNISPFHPELRLAEPAAANLALTIILDGDCVGVAATDTLQRALDRLRRPACSRRVFAVHCLLGHQPAELARLQRSLGSERNYFWVHDYSSLCAGYSLLRNDASFCGAPPPGSTACRICVYGALRRSHLAAVRALFEAVPFHVVAPSVAALAVWRAGAELPHLTASVREHCRLVPRAGIVRPGLRGSVEDPVRVAFIGNPRAMKGWPIWLELIARCRRLGVYRFMHFANPGALTPVGGVEAVACVSTADDRDAMTAALAAREIDLVVMPSIWPETFSYVTYEALAAGADIVCLADGGNIGAVTRRLGRGVVLADGDALIGFFSGLDAVAHVRRRQPASLVRSELVHCGTTAALDLMRPTLAEIPLLQAGE